MEICHWVSSITTWKICLSTNVVQSGGHSAPAEKDDLWWRHKCNQAKWAAENRNVYVAHCITGIWYGVARVTIIQRTHTGSGKILFKKETPPVILRQRNRHRYRPKPEGNSRRRSEQVATQKTVITQTEIPGVKIQRIVSQLTARTNRNLPGAVRPLNWYHYSVSSFKLLCVKK